MTMAAGDESSGEGADDRSKPLKMTATTRGFRSLYLLHQSMHQMYKNAKPNSPNSPPSSMATATDGSSFHDAVRLFSDTGEQGGVPAIPSAITGDSFPMAVYPHPSRPISTPDADPTPLPNPAAHAHDPIRRLQQLPTAANPSAPCDPTMASSVRTLHALQPDLAVRHHEQLNAQPTSPSAPSARTRHAHLLHPKSSLFLPQNPSHPFRPTARHRTADPSAQHDPHEDNRHSSSCRPPPIRPPRSPHATSQHLALALRSAPSDSRPTASSFAKARARIQQPMCNNQNN
ncbi:hypothetical protein ACLOJK_036917 [Asimina triloba]